MHCMHTVHVHVCMHCMHACLGHSFFLHLGVSLIGQGMHACMLRVFFFLHLGVSLGVHVDA